MNFLQRIAIVVIVFLTTVGCDQLSKEIARQALEYSPPVSLLGDFVRLEYAENTGMMLSLGSSLSPHLRFYLFAIIAGIVLTGILVYILISKTLDGTQVAGLSLLAGGGFGNLIDRIVHDGVVIDFVTIGIGNVRTAIFNFADVAVLGAIALLLLHKKRESPEDSHRSKDPDSR